MRTTAASAALILALAGCGSSGKPSKPKATSTATTTATAPSALAKGAEIAPGTVRGTSGALTATMHASTHGPKAGAAWPISFTVTRAGRPVKASVRYQYLLAGQVVARRSHYTFRGRFADVFRWPGSAIGYPLTFRAVIVVGASTIDLDYPVRVHR